MMIMIKCILFDMGGVILTSKIEIILVDVSKSLGVPLSALMDIRNKFKIELWDGKMDVSDIAGILKKDYSLNLSVEEILLIWEQTYLKSTVPNVDCIKLANFLMKKYKVGLISNLWNFHVKINEKRNLYAGFDPLILSCKIGLHKPQKEIFELALKKSGVLGSECIFVDDREEYFPIARKLGMKTIAFSSVENLKSELSILGVVVD